MLLGVVHLGGGGIGGGIGGGGGGGDGKQVMEKKEKEDNSFNIHSVGCPNPQSSVFYVSM